jgi:hypothetical protein
MEIQMATYDVHIQFDDFETPYCIPNAPEGLVESIIQRYSDENCRRREAVKTYWITLADSKQKIFSTPPRVLVIRCD